ncbi:MAG TPA: alternative ribosome rescue aminoacyl-tRNA hydrolase ArfB [Chitinophagales bacterium]
MFHFEKIISELTFKTSRSSGAGGQNVNKVETKVEVLWNVSESQFVSEEVKQKLLERLVKKMNVKGEISVSCDTSRSQLKNKELAISKLKKLLENALKERKKRVATKPTKASVERAKKAKTKRSKIKQNRGKIDLS